MAGTCPWWCSGGHTCVLWALLIPTGQGSHTGKISPTNTLGLQIQKIDSVPKWGLQETEQRGILRNGPRDAPPSRNWGGKGSSMNWKGISAGGRTSSVCIFPKVEFRKSVRKGSLEADTAELTLMQDPTRERLTARSQRGGVMYRNHSHRQPQMSVSMEMNVWLESTKRTWKVKAWRLRQTTLEDLGRIRILDLLILERMASLERKTKGVRKISNFWNNLEQMKKHRTLW